MIILDPTPATVESFHGKHGKHSPRLTLTLELPLTAYTAAAIAAAMTTRRLLLTIESSQQPLTETGAAQ